jgi:hypothetical protein
METPKMPGEAPSQGTPPQTPAPTNGPTTAIPHLEIIGVEAEPIPWVQVPRPGSNITVCDYFRIKLKIAIYNRGDADFPPKENLHNVAHLMFTVLYGEKEEEDWVGQTRTYQDTPFSFPYHNPLDIPAGGTVYVEREFRVARQYPLNPFKIVAWFIPPVWEHRPSVHEDPPKPPIKYAEIPPSDAPMIQQMASTPSGERILLQLDGKPFTSDQFSFEGPDIKPVQWFYEYYPEKPSLYNVGVVFENVGQETNGSVQVSFSATEFVLDSTDGANRKTSISGSHVVEGPFAQGMHAIVFCDQIARGDPDWSSTIIQTSLLCPKANLSVLSIGDINLINDIVEVQESSDDDIFKYLEAMNKPKEELEREVAEKRNALLSSCITVKYFGNCDSSSK